MDRLDDGRVLVCFDRSCSQVFFLQFGEIMLNVFQLADGVWVEGPGTYKYTQSHLVTSAFKQILGFLRF